MAQLTALSSTGTAESSAVFMTEPVTIGAKIAEKLVKETMKADDAAAKAQEVSAKDRDGILRQLNKTLEVFDTHVSLSLDDKSHQNVIKVIDNESGKVVRQIPSEQLMRISERINELLGVIYDEKM